MGLPQKPTTPLFSPPNVQGTLTIVMSSMQRLVQKLHDPMITTYYACVRSSPTWIRKPIASARSPERLTKQFFDEFVLTQADLIRFMSTANLWNFTFEVFGLLYFYIPKENS